MADDRRSAPSESGMAASGRSEEEREREDTRIRGGLLSRAEAAAHGVKVEHAARRRPDDLQNNCVQRCLEGVQNNTPL